MPMPWFHADRALGGDRDHRGFDRPVVAGETLGRLPRRVNIYTIEANGTAPGDSISREIAHRLETVVDSVLRDVNGYDSEMRSIAGAVDETELIEDETCLCVETRDVRLNPLCAKLVAVAADLPRIKPVAAGRSKCVPFRVIGVSTCSSPSRWLAS
jgi:hypothetical protein